MEMKELFLKNPEYMLVFADEQEALKEAFTQATKHIQQKFVKVLRDKLLEKGYNFSSLSSYESEYPEGFAFGTSCGLLSFPDNISIKVKIFAGHSINCKELFSYGFFLRTTLVNGQRKANILKISKCYS